MKTKVVTNLFATCAIFLVASCAKSPEACMTVNKDKTAKLNEEVQFDANCSTNAETFNWDFGDGTSATGISSKHKYTTAANYVVKLTATSGSKTSVKNFNLAITP